MTVTELPKTETPIEEIDAVRRLGEALKRGRAGKEMDLETFAGKMNLSEVYLVEVERGTAVFDANQCREASIILSIDYEMLLEAAKAWHAATWEAAKGKPGFQLVEQAAEGMGLAGTEPELEKMATEVLFTGVAVAQSCLKMGHDLLQACNRLQAVLIARGVLLPNPPDQPDPSELVPSDSEDDSPQAVDNLGTEES